MTDTVLSVVIPTLNEAGSITRTLLALQVLRELDVEVILTDGGSTDATISVAKTMVDRVVSAPKGRAKQMNVGAQAATGQWLLFIHADTILPDDIIAWHQYIQSSTACWGFFPLRLDGKHFLFRCIESAISLRSRISRVATGDQCLFVKRELFNRIGGFDDIPLMEDVAISKTLRRLHKPLVWCSAVTTSSRRWQRNGIIKTVLLMWRLRLAYFLGACPQRLYQRYYD